MAETRDGMAQTAAANPDGIADRIVDAILAGRLEAGQRLGEQSLADIFHVSRTIIREALGRLSARGMVEVNARKGWYVVQPSASEAKDAFDARIAVETGLMHALPARVSEIAIRRLKQHIVRERAAIRGRDASKRSYLLGDFHVCLAETVGNALLADILKDLTARTTLIASLYQSTHDAARSCDDHADIVAAIESGNRALAARRVREHIEDVAKHLGTPLCEDPHAHLRAALLPANEKPPSRRAARPKAPQKVAQSLLEELIQSSSKPATRRKSKEKQS